MPSSLKITLVLSLLFAQALIPGGFSEAAAEIHPRLLDAITRMHDAKANGPTATGQPQPAAFTIGLIGDLPYTEQEIEKFDNLITDLNEAELAFVVHDGDFKSGGSPCSDTLFLTRLKQLQTIEHPLIYLPGDNDWTDCHRKHAGRYDPLERLEFLRKHFFPHDFSLGDKPIPLIRQSIVPGYEAFTENVLWLKGEVLFVGLHLIGGNNNLGRKPTGKAEYPKRNAANLYWLHSAFAIAERFNLKGVMLFIHANPLFDKSYETHTGFSNFLEALREAVLHFARPVVLVHGDTHYFRVDGPMFNHKTGSRVSNFTRVETFGSPYVNWVRAIINPNHPDLFSFKPMRIDDSWMDHILNWPYAITK